MIDALDWRELAACRGVESDVFYPVGYDWSGPGNSARAQVALAICADCPVADACLSDALARGDTWAVLGGTLPDQRRAPAHVA